MTGHDYDIQKVTHMPLNRPLVQAWQIMQKVCNNNHQQAYSFLFFTSRKLTLNEVLCKIRSLWLIRLFSRRRRVPDKVSYLSPAEAAFWHLIAEDILDKLVSWEITSPVDESSSFFFFAYKLEGLWKTNVFLSNFIERCFSSSFAVVPSSSKIQIPYPKFSNF